MESNELKNQIFSTYDLYLMYKVHMFKIFCSLEIRRLREFIRKDQLLIFIFENIYVVYF